MKMRRGFITRFWKHIDLEEDKFAMPGSASVGASPVSHRNSLDIQGMFVSQSGQEVRTHQLRDSLLDNGLVDESLDKSKSDGQLYLQSTHLLFFRS